jgi:aminocarboxymuconate-semialdehyde decarboxylase
VDALTIDIHCHAHVFEADELAAGSFQPAFEPMIRHATNATRETNRQQMQRLRPQLTSVEARLHDMDERGVDLQVISPSPFQLYYWAEPELGLRLAQSVNDALATLVDKAPARFFAFGSIPMQDPRLALGELERLARDLRFRGVELATSVEGVELSAERFAPIFARAEELGLVVFIHPNGFDDGARLTQHYFSNLIGNPLDTTIALSYLIFDGVLARHPRLKLCAAHGGGYLPAYAARMDHAWNARPDCKGRIEKLPSSYLRQVYVDTVVFSPIELKHLIEAHGADRVVMGTDYPYDMAEMDPLALLLSIEALSETELAKMLGANAASLLNIEH